MSTVLACRRRNRGWVPVRVKWLFLSSTAPRLIRGPSIYWSNGLSVLLPLKWPEDEAEKALPIRAEVRKSWSNSSSVRHVYVERCFKAHGNSFNIINTLAYYTNRICVFRMFFTADSIDLYFCFIVTYSFSWQKKVNYSLQFKLFSCYNT